MTDTQIKGKDGEVMTTTQEPTTAPAPTGMAVIVAVTHPLDSTYRCVRCDAQAYVEVQMQNGDLYFCMHHYQGNKDKLQRTAIRIIDHGAWLQEQTRLFKGGMPIK